MKLRLFALSLFLGVLLGCANSAYKVHPGSAGYTTGTPTTVQIAASQWYDDLSATDAVIVQTRADFLANKFPASAMPTIRNAFNALVSAYDTAQQAWLAFNQAATAGQSGGQAATASAIAGMDAALQQLTAAKGGK